MYDRARTHLIQSAETQRRVSGQCLDPIIEAAVLIAEAFKAGKKIMLCGNGGSAADCQHIAAEFVSTLTQDFKRPGLGAMALTTDTSLMTAYSNDYGFEGLFARQVEALGVPGDILIGISTSGNSQNVIRAIEAAKKRKMGTVVLAGAGGRMAEMADVVIAVPCEKTQHIQESHIAIGHILCDLVERSLFNAE
jgi:phosphoheptose isomerase